MKETAPAAAFIVAKRKLLLEFGIIGLDRPTSSDLSDYNVE